MEVCHSFILILLLTISTAALSNYFFYRSVAEYGNCNIVCPLVFDPVCGTDGKTYGNACLLAAENACNGTNVKIAHKGECKSHY